jgi:serine/threonine-protein kinase
MAPEMYRNSAAPPAAASRSTDVYAFGTLVHEVLSARVPWAGFTETERTIALREGGNLDMAALPKDTPPSVAALVARCLALDRAARPRAAEVLAALEQAHENVVSGHFVGDARGGGLARAERARGEMSERRTRARRLAPRARSVARSARAIVHTLARPPR